MRTINFLNLKGGVAKIFSASNMAYELWRRGYKVLVLDNDKQGNISKAYGKYDAEQTAPVTRLYEGARCSGDTCLAQTEPERRPSGLRFRTDRNGKEMDTDGKIKQRAVCGRV